MEKISVILTSYNDKEKYLRYAVESILHQTFDNFKLIIVLEPNDNNIALLEEYSNKDNRILLIINEIKQGFVKSLNIGLNHAHGEYIARMDGDDISNVNRFEKQVEFLEKNEHIDIVGSNIDIIDATDLKIATRFYPKMHNDIKKKFLFTNAMAHPTVMLRKQCIDSFRGYNDDFKFSEDLEFWLRLLVKGCKFENIQESLLMYRTVDILEKRVQENWEFNYKARKLHSFKIWNPIYASFGLYAIWIVKSMPNKLLSLIFKSNIVNFIKGKK